MVTAGERLTNLVPQPTAATGCSVCHDAMEGLHLLRQGRDLIFYITRATHAKSTREYISRCEIYRETGRTARLFCHD